MLMMIMPVSTHIHTHLALCLQLGSCYLDGFYGKFRIESGCRPPEKRICRACNADCVSVIGPVARVVQDRVYLSSSVHSDITMPSCFNFNFGVSARSPFIPRP